MIGLNTNVLTDYVAQDDVIQSPKSTLFTESLSAEESACVSLIVIVRVGVDVFVDLQ